MFGLSVGNIILIVLLVLIAIIAIASRAKIQKGWMSVKKFFREVKMEMLKVAWPTRNSIISDTVVVLIAVVVLTVIISLWDQVLSWVVRFVVS